MDCGKKYNLHMQLTMNKDPNVDLLSGFILSALVSYTRKTGGELSAYQIVLEEES